MEEIILEIGKVYKDRSGRLIKITEGNPPVIIDGILTKDGWNGVYWGDSVDDKTPKINKGRYKFNGKHWDCWSIFSGIITGEPDNSFNELEKDLIDLIG